MLHTFSSLPRPSEDPVKPAGRWEDVLVGSEQEGFCSVLLPTARQTEAEALTLNSATCGRSRAALSATALSRAQEPITGPRRVPEQLPRGRGVACQLCITVTHFIPLPPLPGATAAELIHTGKRSQPYPCIATLETHAHGHRPSNNLPSTLRRHESGFSF